MAAEPQTQPQPQETAVHLFKANYYEIRRGEVRITYMEARAPFEKPQLHYDDGHQQRTYSGDEIHIEETALGLLVSVDRVILDGPTRQWTVVLPTVQLAGGPERLSTFVVSTHVAGGLAGFPLVPGPVETYSVQTFRGTARFIAWNTAAQ